MTIAVIHPQASKADQLPGKLQQSKEEVSASYLVASPCTWSCYASWVTKQELSQHCPAPPAPAWQLHTAAYALLEPSRYKTAPGYN